MCDMKPTICITSQEFYMTPHWLFMTTVLYSWGHIHCIHDNTPTLYDITYSILATSQPLSYVYDSIINIYDISYGVWMTIQPLYPTSHSQYLCNHTHLIDDITPFVCMKSHPLNVGHHRHYLWHHILSWWHRTIVYMSWNPLCFWHHIQYIWWHTLCVWQHKLYIWLETHSICHHIYCICHHNHSVEDITPTM